jgi:hypothetical protein
MHAPFIAQSQRVRAHVEPPVPATPPDPPHPSNHPRPIREPGDEPPPSVQDPVIDNPLTPPDPGSQRGTGRTPSIARSAGRVGTFAVAGVAALLLAACNPTDRQDAAKSAKDAGGKVADATRSAGQSVMKATDDAAVTAKVKGSLIADEQIKSLKIDVDTKDGQVTLAGRVANDAQKARAEQLAMNVEGVKGVRNELATEPATTAKK